MITVSNRCGVIGCDGLVIAIGLCGKHYKRHQRHGDVLHRKNAEAAQGNDKHPLYAVWRNITRTKKGSLVCEKWKSFSAFVLDVKEKPNDAHSFQRIDRNGIYEVGNVVWKCLQSSAEDRKIHKEYMRVYSQKQRDNNPRYFWNASLKKFYGVTADWYDEQFEKQNGMCAICGRPERMRIKGKEVRLAVDHCHITNTVRGLLCSTCNSAIGLLNHDMQILESALKYLAITK